MPLLMKGGGFWSKKHPLEPSCSGRGQDGCPQRGPIKTVQPKVEKSNTAARRRQSSRLNLKRPRDKHEDSISQAMQCCALCTEELEEKNEKTQENLIFCCICGRGFHLACSGVQDGWGYLKLECRHHELDSWPISLSISYPRN